MLAIILSTAFAGYELGYGHKYHTLQDYLNPARLAKKEGKQEMRKANIERLRAQVADSQAALIAAEEVVQRKAEKLTRLQELFRRYNEHQQGIQQILAEIAQENRVEVTEAKQEENKAQIEVEKAAQEAGQLAPSASPVVGDAPPVLPMTPGAEPAPAAAPLPLNEQQTTPVGENVAQPASSEPGVLPTNEEPATALQSPTMAPASLAASFAGTEPTTELKGTQPEPIVSSTAEQPVPIVQ